MISHSSVLNYMWARSGTWNIERDWDRNVRRTDETIRDGDNRDTRTAGKGDEEKGD